MEVFAEDQEWFCSLKDTTSARRTVVSSFFRGCALFLCFKDVELAFPAAQLWGFVVWVGFLIWIGFWVDHCCSCSCGGRFLMLEFYFLGLVVACFR